MASKLELTVKIEDLSFWKDIESIILDSLEDQRITEDVRREYGERYNQATKPKEK